MAPSWVSYPTYAGFLKRGLDGWQWAGSLFDCFASICLRVSDSWQYVHSVWMSEMDALAIKKLTVGHLHLEPASAIYCGSNYKLLTWHTLLNT